MNEDLEEEQLEQMQVNKMVWNRLSKYTWNSSINLLFGAYSKGDTQLYGIDYDTEFEYELAKSLLTGGIDGLQAKV